MDGAQDHRAERIARRRLKEDANLFGRLSAVATASRAHAKRYLDAGGGLSIPEWRILWDLSEAGPLSIQDMATIQRADHSLISRTVPAMRDKGFVSIRRDATDKRQSMVHLTDAGLAAYQKAAPFMQARRDALAAFFPGAELRDFLAMIDRFEAYLAQPLADAGGNGT